MPQDPLQIALEHHRAGRLRQAETGYRAVLEAEPGHPEALNWLGVLFFQAGRADLAAPLLRQAAEGRPGEASHWYNLGQACLRNGARAEAVDAFGRAAGLDPRPQTLFALGLAFLAGQSPGEARAAADAFRRAQEAGMDTPELHRHLAMACLAAGDADAALSAGRAALQGNPDDPLNHYHLALAYRGKGEGKEVRKALLKAVELDPTMAQAWNALATLDAEAGNLSTAAGLYRRAIKAKPDYAAAHEGLARVLRALGQEQAAATALAQAAQAKPVQREERPLPEAVAELEQRLTDPGTAALHYALAAQSDIFPPDHVPSSLISRLFDRYAGKFDTHLGGLHYCVPDLLAQALPPLLPERKIDVLDLGCGTGLCGPLIRPYASTLAGVDLSPGMIDKAKERGVYDRLEVGELVETLRSAPPRSYDLLIAADVLIYLGDLSPTFEAAAAALRPGGLLAFSVEAGGGDRYLLNRKTRRFTHARVYLERLAEIHGFRVETFQEMVGRYEANEPVDSYLVILRRQFDTGAQ